MRTTKEERADLRARCRAGVIAITTDAALVAALVDDVEELDALVDNAARSMAKLATASTAELDRLHAERNEARAERDARPKITAEDAASFVRFYDSPATCNSREWNAAQSVLEALRAHAGKVAR